MVMPDDESWMKPWVRDFRGLNNARPTPEERGLALPTSSAPLTVPSFQDTRGVGARSGGATRPRQDLSLSDGLEQKRVPTGLAGWQAEKAKDTVKNGRSNARAIIRLLPALRAELRAQGVSNMPEPLLLGWISQESSGDPRKFEPRKDEIGIWQVSLGERKDMGSTEPGGARDLRAQMLGPSRTGNTTAQIRVGVELIKFYQRTLVRSGMATDAPALPQMVRFAHNLGIHQARKLITEIVEAHEAGRTPVNPTAASWSEIIAWAAQHRPAAFLNAMRTADYAIMAGQEIERQMTSQPRP
jgi:hypothetical protein